MGFTLVFGERAVWETYLGEARRFVRENRGALLRAVLKGWLGPRAVCGLVAKAWVPQAWLAARGVCRWVRDFALSRASTYVDQSDRKF